MPYDATSSVIVTPQDPNDVARWQGPEFAQPTPAAGEEYIGVGESEVDTRSWLPAVGNLERTGRKRQASHLQPDWQSCSDSAKRTK